MLSPSLVLVVLSRVPLPRCGVYPTRIGLSRIREPAFFVVLLTQQLLGISPLVTLTFIIDAHLEPRYHTKNQVMIQLNQMLSTEFDKLSTHTHTYKLMQNTQPARSRLQLTGKYDRTRYKAPQMRQQPFYRSMTYEHVT